MLSQLIRTQTPAANCMTRCTHFPVVSFSLSTDCCSTETVRLFFLPLVLLVFLWWWKTQHADGKRWIGRRRSMHARAHRAEQRRGTPAGDQIWHIILRALQTFWLTLIPLKPWLYDFIQIFQTNQEASQLHNCWWTTVWLCRWCYVTVVIMSERACVCVFLFFSVFSWVTWLSVSMCMAL